MLPESCVIQKRTLEVEEAKESISQAVICLNPSHGSTIAAMQERYGIKVEIPEKPPLVNLQVGDRLVVMSVRGLPRLAENRHYTHEEIESATFKFSLYVCE